MATNLPVSSGPIGAPFLLIVLGALVWVIGGNIVIARQFKRRGMPSTAGFTLGGLLKVSLNRGETLALIAMAAVALGFVTLGATRI